VPIRRLVSNSDKNPAISAPVVPIRPHASWAVVSRRPGRRHSIAVARATVNRERIVIRHSSTPPPTPPTSLRFRLPDIRPTAFAGRQSWRLARRPVFVATPRKSSARQPSHSASLFAHQPMAHRNQPQWFRKCRQRNRPEQGAVFRTECSGAFVVCRLSCLTFYAHRTTRCSGPARASVGLFMVIPREPLIAGVRRCQSSTTDAET